MRGKAQRLARPVQTRLQNVGVSGPKFTKFLKDVDGVIGVDNACIHAAILASVVECKRTE